MRQSNRRQVKNIYHRIRKAGCEVAGSFNAFYIGDFATSWAARMKVGEKHQQL
jgi:hypothetical protein